VKQLPDFDEWRECVRANRPLGLERAEHRCAAKERLKIGPELRWEVRNDLVRHALFVANPLQQPGRDRNDLNTSTIAEQKCLHAGILVHLSLARKPGTSPGSYPVLGFTSRVPTLRPMASRIKAIGKQRFLSLLRRMRLDAGLRQADLARKLGQPQSFVSKYESGERRIDVLELRQICMVLGVSLSEFVRRLEGESE